MSLRSLRLCIVFAFLAPSLTHAATLEIPGPGTTLSGIGVISGWKCQANGPLTVSFDGGDALPLLYGSERPDVLDAGACASAEVGFVAIWNWSNLDDGEHTAVAYDNGVEFARSTFTVVRASEEESFLGDVTAECTVPDFPNAGTNARFEWSTGTQHLELAEVGEDVEVPVSTQFDGEWNFEMTPLNDTSASRCEDILGIPPSESYSVENGIVRATGEWDTQEGGIFSFLGIIGNNGYLEGTLYDIVNPETDDEFSVPVGSLEGIFEDNRTGRGSWFLVTPNCAGQWTATKQ